MEGCHAPHAFESLNYRKTMIFRISPIMPLAYIEIETGDKRLSKWGDS
jgi:hypothetical protein